MVGINRSFGFALLIALALIGTVPLLMGQGCIGNNVEPIQTDWTKMGDSIIKTPMDQTIPDQWESQILARILLNGLGLLVVCAGFAAQPAVRRAQHYLRRRRTADLAAQMEPLWNRATEVRPGLSQADPHAASTEEPEGRLHREIVEIRDAMIDPRVAFQVSTAERTLLERAVRLRDEFIIVPKGTEVTAETKGVDGQVYFENPGVLGGRLMHDIRLRWERGCLVEAAASTNQDYLQSIVRTDAGAGLIGAGLARVLRDSHDVVVVDVDAARCAEIYAELGVLTIHGSATDIGVLIQAGVERADVAVALMRDDADNLTFTLICKQYGVAHRMVRMRDTRYREAYDLAGATFLLNVLDLYLHELILAIERPRATRITARGRLQRQRRMIRLSRGRSSSPARRAISSWTVANWMTPGTPVIAAGSGTRPTRSALLARA